MKKETEGIVIAIEGDIAKVKASRHSDCESCGACPGDKAAVLDVYNPLGATIGQKVNIEIPEAKMLKAAFVVYMLPIITTFAGFFFGVWLAEKYVLNEVLTEVSTSVAALLITLIYIKMFDRSTSGKKKMMPVVTRILR